MSTDASVVAPTQLEVELGYFTLERVGGQISYTTPDLVLNYGLVNAVEIVGEFGIEQPQETGDVADPGLFLKAVLRPGVLQGAGGISVAMEAGPLLPSTKEGERGVGFEGLGIASGRWSDLTFHLNAGGGVDRSANDPFALWGAIVELPAFESVRVVGEVNGESTRGQSPVVSALLGAIWNVRSAAIDGGVRRGLTPAAPDWELTLGLTFSFSTPEFFAGIKERER
ncbi:MAG: hypothetical protein HY699_02605 [Deltaproteobacteria bacterium]|nr:hypothetical protein [Deltaproteobacteria bacterium]